MSSNRLFFCLLLLTCSSWPLAADPDAADQPPPPPTPPLLQKMPDWCCWTEIYTPKTGMAPPSKQPGEKAVEKADEKHLKSIVVTKVGKVRHDLETWDDGTTTELWIYRGVEMHAYPGTPPPIRAMDVMTNRDARTYGVRDFAGLAWLSLGHYVDVESYAGTKCYLFRIKATRSLGAPTTLSAEDRAECYDRQLWIDVSSKMPIAYDDGQSVRVYHFSSDRPDPLALPDPFLAKFQLHNSLENDPQRHAAVR